MVSGSHGLSTYKELCSLASDLNQPDLVYKFMNLANHHAMWNSRKVSCLYSPVFTSVTSMPLPTWSCLSSFQGAAFGFHMIAAKAGEQLAPFLPQIIPRLYRYQFDPNLSIRQAMTSIWDALVTDKTLVRADCCTFASIKKTNYKTLFVFRKKWL